MRIHAFHRLTTTVTAGLCVAFATMVCGCDDDGPAENAGEEIDEAVEDAGEAIDEAVEDLDDPNSDGGG